MATGAASAAATATAPAPATPATPATATRLPFNLKKHLAGSHNYPGSLDPKTALTNPNPQMNSASRSEP